MPQKIFKNMNFIFRIFGGSLGAAQWEFRDTTRWGYTWDTVKNIKLNIFRKRLFVFDENIFERFWKIENFKKSLFQKKNEKWKISKSQLFPRKSQKFSIFQKMKKWLFEIFDFSKSSEKYFRKMFTFYFLIVSHIEP